jgi:hypothetical protein
MATFGHADLLVRLTGRALKGTCLDGHSNSDRQVAHLVHAAGGETLGNEGGASGDISAYAHLHELKFRTELPF